MEGAGAHFHVVGLQDHAALRGPEMLQGQDQSWNDSVGRRPDTGPDLAGLEPDLATLIWVVGGMTIFEMRKGAAPVKCATSVTRNQATLKIARISAKLEFKSPRSWSVNATDGIILQRAEVLLDGQKRRSGAAHPLQSA